MAKVQDKRRQLIKLLGDIGMRDLKNQQELNCAKQLYDLLLSTEEKEKS